MVGINQPSNQIKLTNVSIVRIKKGKKRFELACYKNQVLAYRAGTITDLDEVLQIHNIFTSVTKGAVAKKADLDAAFPDKKLYPNMDAIILDILKRGELQVGDKERSAQLDQMHHEVLRLVAEKCIDPASKRPYTSSMIEKALAELRENPKFQEEPKWTGVVAGKPAKALALDAIRALVKHQPLPIARARMRIRVVLPAGVYKKLKPQVVDMYENVAHEEFLGTDEGWECVGTVEPGKYKTLGELIGTETRGKGTVEVLEMADVGEGEEVS